MTEPAVPAPVVVIAEIGVNHNGSLKSALELVDAAAEAGADLVKIQTFKSDKLVTRATRQAAYQTRNLGQAAAGEGGQLTMLRALELDDEAHRVIAAYAAECGVGFLSTPFDAESTDFLIDGLGLTLIKVGSGDMTNAPHLLRLAKRGIDVILSSGMATMEEVARALGCLAFGYLGWSDPSSEAFLRALNDPNGREALARKVTLLHCTSNYPTPFDEINLAVMDSFRAAFTCPVGFSDHSEGIAVAIGAVARGARMIEKHLTLDRSLPGPDHRASIEPTDFAAMTTGIRAIERAIGDPHKTPTPGEIDTMAVARKSLVASISIAAGEVFSADNLGVKRPGSGLSPEEYWRLLGRPASRAYAPDDLIDERVQAPSRQDSP